MQYSACDFRFVHKYILCTLHFYANSFKTPHQCDETLFFGREMQLLLLKLYQSDTPLKLQSNGYFVEWLV
jgi:hypothetical protein